MTVKTTVSTKDIDEAFLRLKDIVKETPLQLDHYLSQKYDCKVYLKREDLQWVRSFKLEVLTTLFLFYQMKLKVKVLHVRVQVIMLKVLPIQLKT